MDAQCGSILKLENPRRIPVRVERRHFCEFYLQKLIEIFQSILFLTRTDFRRTILVELNLLVFYQSLTCLRERGNPRSTNEVNSPGKRPTKRFRPNNRSPERFFYHHIVKGLFTTVPFTKYTISHLSKRIKNYKAFLKKAKNIVQRD